MPGCFNAPRREWLQPASAMADCAYAAFLRNWTWDALAPRVWAAAEDALRLGSRLLLLPKGHS